LTLPGLYAVLDAEVAAAQGWSLETLARALLDGGARFFQIRGKSLSAGALLAAARAVVSLAAPLGGLVVVNDRPDVSRLAGAAGAHLGQDDLSPADARAVVGPDAILGLSTHTAVQVADAAHEPISYIAVGPIFATRTKYTAYAPVGLDLVRAAATTGLPVVAIGGITLDRAADVIEAGATSVAVIGDLLTGGTPSTRAHAFVERLTAAGAAL
jgi:thiamine-phosphate pyrophosphorylase